MPSRSRGIPNGIPLSNSTTTRQWHKTFRELLKIPLACWVCNAFSDDKPHIKKTKKNMGHSRYLSSARIGRWTHRKKWPCLIFALSAPRYAMMIHDSLVDLGEPYFQTTPKHLKSQLLSVKSWACQGAGHAPVPVVFPGWNHVWSSLKTARSCRGNADGGIVGCQVRNFRWAPAKNEGVNWLSNKKYSLYKQQFLGLWGVNQYFLGG